MARRRYQQGQVFIRGKRLPVWIGRWREDIITPEGKIKRVRKSEVLGTRKQYPTKRLALRVLEDRLSPINDPSYRAAPTISFRAFADKWQKTVLVQHDPSTQKADRSRLRVHLLPVLGDVELRDFNAQRLQDFIAHSKASPKSIKNMIALLRSIWTRPRHGATLNTIPSKVLFCVNLTRTSNQRSTLLRCRGSSIPRRSRMTLPSG